MSLINIQNVVCMQNIQQLNDILSFKIRFDCLENINQEIEWKVTFISDPSDNKQDQILDQFVMGPLQKGTMEFQIQVDSPNYSKVSQILEVSGLTISCSFYDQVFFICGYYVNHYIQDEQYRQWYEEQVQNGVQVGLDLQKVVRHIDSQNPRVTNCKIEWENPSVCGLQINGQDVNQVVMQDINNQPFNQNQVNNDNFGAFMNSNNFNNVECSMKNTFESNMGY